MQCHAGTWNFYRYAYPLSWQYHVNDLSIKLNTANALLFQMRKYVGLKILRSFSFAIFDSYYPTVVLYGLIIVALFNEL